MNSIKYSFCITIAKLKLNQQKNYLQITNGQILFQRLEFDSNKMYSI